MKKIFTILLAVGSISFASAQSRNDWSHDKGNAGNIIYSQPMPRDIYRGTTMANNPFDRMNNRGTQIREINHTSVQKIQLMKNNRFFRSRQRNDQIRFLARQDRNRFGW